ncbi:MAG: hypothetical protein EOO61_04535 [Hymenobacter sp.]|nr:MAG: hypothetical protein EOO61_04535 [Hymenobacter sp.]
MVTLYMTALDADAHERVFTCTLTTLEYAFDFLNHVVARGNMLLSAFVVDESGRTELPLAAFDGLPTTTTIQALIDEWTSILNKPISANSANQQVLIELTRRRLRSQQARQVWLREMIEHYSQWQQWSMDDVRWSARQRRVTHRYATQLARHQTQLADTRRVITALTNRLTHLAAGVGA